MSTRPGPLADLRGPWAPPGSRVVPGHRLPAAADAAPQPCRVIDEDVLTIDVEGVGRYALMWCPAEGDHGAAGYVAGDGLLGDGRPGDGPVPERLALAAGFAFTEGLVGGLADIASLAVCPDRPDVVRLRLVAPGRAAPRRRDVVVTSACGFCGGREALGAALDDVPPVGDRLRLDAAALGSLMAKMQRGQPLFRTTGGAHAAGVFSPEHRLVAVAEDLGRHNALDKAIGRCLLEGRPLAGHGVVLSSRLSYEMVAKAARAGFELVAAVSAPTSLAVELAERAGITLCGFVRGDTATVYTHPHRLRETACAAAAPDSRTMEEYAA